MYKRFFRAFCLGILIYFLFVPNSASKINTIERVANINIKNISKLNSDRLPLPDSIPHPNGIAVTNGSMYVGSVTTGAVAKIDLQTSKSELLVEPQTAIIASNSLRADEARGILWACSPDVFPKETKRQPSTLVALDLDNGTVINRIALPQDGFCNDLAIDDRGGVLVTDSFNPRILYLPPNESEFEVWLRDESWGVDKGLGLSDVGLSGIAISLDKTVYVGMFTSGQLYRIQDRQVEPIQLSRQIVNPDGMAVAPDGSLIVCEGNYETGNGRLLQISLAENLTGEINILAEGLDSPVNLSLNSESIWLTEGRLRSLLRSELNLPQPNSFWVRRVFL